MFKKIFEWNFFDEYAAMSMHNSSRGIKSYSPLLLNVSPFRNKMAFWRKVCCFWAQEFSRTHTFQIAFYGFWQESSFLALLIVEKKQGLFFNPEKGLGAFLTSKKEQDAILTLKKGRVHFWLLKKGRMWHPAKNVKHEHYVIVWFLIG